MCYQKNKIMFPFYLSPIQFPIFTHYLTAGRPQTDYHLKPMIGCNNLPDFQFKVTLGMFLVQYPVLLSTQSGLHFIPWQTCSFHYQLHFRKFPWKVQVIKVVGSTDKAALAYLAKASTVSKGRLSGPCVARTFHQSTTLLHVQSVIVSTNDMFSKNVSLSFVA